MVTKIGQGRRRHLYITEWMEAKGLSDQKIGDRLDKSRTTIHRWRTQQHRLNPEKIATLASAMNMEPEDFWRLPSRPSLDAILHDAPDELHETAVDIVRRLAQRA